MHTAPHKQLLVALALGSTTPPPAAAVDYSSKLLLDSSPVTGCSGFYDLEFAYAARVSAAPVGRSWSQSQSC